MINATHPLAPLSARKRQSGLTLWDTLLLLGAVAGLLVAGFVINEASQALRRADDNRALLEWADHRVIAFAATRGRLPCPDVDGDGVEDCAGGAQKGWLPLGTLGLANSAPLLGPIRLRYAVYRQGGELDQGGGPSNTFEPISGNDTGALVSRRALGNVSGVDFCFRLASALNADSTAAAAHVVNAGQPSNIAYALAASGAGRGISGSFGGHNADASPAMELPARTPDTDYGDTVRIRTLGELSDALGCAAAMASLNGLSLMVEVVDEVDSMKAATTRSAAIGAAMAGVKIGVLIVKAALSGYLIATAIATLATASAALSAAIASCVVLVGCAAIPALTAAVFSAGLAIGFGATALALNLVAIVPMTVALGLSIAAAVRAGAEVDSTGIDLGAALDDLRAQRDQARADATAARNEANAASEQANALWETQSSRYNELISFANGIEDEALRNAVRALIDTSTARARELVEAELQQSLAEGRYQAANNEYNSKRAFAEEARARANDDPGDTAKSDAASRLERERDTALEARNTAYTNWQNASTATNNARDAHNAAITAANAVIPGLGSVIHSYYYVAYRDARGAQYLADERNANANALEQAAQQMAEAYDQVAAAIANPDGTSGGGTAIWSGALNVLRAADQRGTGLLASP